MSKFQKKDPDHGPQIKTGDIPFDKGYETSGQELDEIRQAGAKKVMV